MRALRWTKLLHFKNTLAITSILLGFALPTHAQLTQPHRYEKPQKGSDEYFMLISLKEEGLALFRDLNKYKSGNKTWELILLDTALQEKNTVQLEIKDRHRMVGYEHTPGHLYFLFRTGETTKNDFEIIDVDLKGFEAERHQFKPDLDFKLTHFNKAGTNFTLGGYVNNEPAVILFALPENHIRVIPGFFQKDTELVDLRTNQNQTFNTVLIDRGTKENRKLIFRTYDETGKQLLEDIVPIDEQKTLQTGITSSLVREDLAIMGTWGERNSKQSIGFYFMTVNPFSEQEIKYIDFGQLEHYLDFMNPKRAERIKANSRDDLAAGKIPNFTSYVMPYNLIEYKDGFLMLAEIYTPVSNASPYYASPYYYNPYYSPYGWAPYSQGYYYPGMNRMYRPYSYGDNLRSTDQVKISETVLISFGADGKVNWDYSLKLDEVKMPGIEQVADFCLHEGQVHLLYKKESELKTKTIVLTDNAAKEGTEKIRTSEVSDIIRSEKESEGGIRQWVGNSFFVWGYQTIRNATKEEKVRDVFYVNKIVVK